VTNKVGEAVLWRKSIYYSDGHRGERTDVYANSTDKLIRFLLIFSVH
jgi:hypothetical protein